MNAQRDYHNRGRIVMRVKPSVPIGISLAVAYTALFGILFKVSGVSYTGITDSADNALKALVIPMAIVATVWLIVTTVFGWWRPVLRDRERAGGWTNAIPMVLALLALAGVDYGNLADMDSKLLLWIGIGVALVGLSEELMYRGLVVVSFRTTLSESGVWLWSSVAFSLRHSINYLLGQDLAPTIQQLVITFVLGSGFYIARRASGTILVPMVLHLLWDYSAFTQGDDHAIAGLVQLVAIAVVVITLLAGHRRLFESQAA